MPKIKQHQIKITLPSDLYSQLVAKNLSEEGEINLSSYIRKLLRVHLKSVSYTHLTLPTIYSV